VRFLIQKALISSIIIFAVLSQSLVYDSGLCYMRTYRQVCTCNHNSQKEIHSKPTSKTDCHEVKKTVHVCSCKKTKNPNELSNLLKQTFFLTSNTLSSLSIHLTHYLFITSNSISNLQGYQLILIKPPRVI
jgi:hypothetical protein